MKRNEIALGLLVMLFTVGEALIASAEEPESCRQPALITPEGQTADGLMLNVICRQAGIKVMYNNLFNADSLDALLAGEIRVPVSMRRAGPVQTLILVPGGSTKGLGAAKIDEKLEMDRVEGLVNRARQLEMPVIVCHLGGESRRGSLSDPFNQQAAEAGDVIIVVQGGNDDGFFTTVAESRGVPLHEVESIPDVGEVMNELFVSE